MTYPGLGGQQPPPQNAAPAASLVPGVTPGVPPILRVTEIIITPGSVLEGIFTYSSNPPAAGTLTESASVETAGTDAYGNHYLAGHATYAAGFATALDAGYVAFYTGSLAAGWTLTGQLETDSAGDLLLSTGGGELTLSAAGNVEITGNLTVDGVALGGQTGAPDGTGFFNTQGLASGSYGSTHQHTLPDFPTATHVHDI